MSNSPLDKHRNPDGTVNGASALSELSGLGSDTVQGIFEHAKANQRKLAGCVAHAFSPVLPLRNAFQQYRCDHCGGEIDSHAFHWFTVGLKQGAEPQPGEVMRRVSDPGELIPGREYWLKDKTLPKAEVATCELDGKYPFFKGRVWAYDGNNQAMKRWVIFGPLPLRHPPEFVLLGGDEG